MNHTALSSEMKSLTPFEWLCVGTLAHAFTATYVVTPRKVHSEFSLTDDPIFTRTVDLKTGRTIELFAHPKLSQDAVDGLCQHYSEEYVRADGFDQMLCFVEEHHHYIGEDGKSSMGKHGRFGKNVYCADLEELHLADNVSISF